MSPNTVPAAPWAPDAAREGEALEGAVEVVDHTGTRAVYIDLSLVFGRLHLNPDASGVKAVPHIGSPHCSRGGFRSRGQSDRGVSVDPVANLVGSATADEDLLPKCPIPVELDRELDPLRDAEDLCVLDQLSEGRIGLVLGTGALDDADLVAELLSALDGARVRGVRVFPRPAQLALPVFSERAPGESRATPISREVRAACLVPLSSEDEALSRREEIDEIVGILAESLEEATP